MTHHDEFVRDEWRRFLARDLRGAVLYFYHRGVPRVAGIARATDMGSSVRFDLVWCACPTADGLSRRSDKHVVLPKTRFADSDSPDVVKFGMNKICMGNAVAATADMVHAPLKREERRGKNKNGESKPPERVQDQDPGPLFKPARSD